MIGQSCSHYYALVTSDGDQMSRCEWQRNYIYSHHCFIQVITCYIVQQFVRLRVWTNEWFGLLLSPQRRILFNKLMKCNGFCFVLIMKCQTIIIFNNCVASSRHLDRKVSYDAGIYDGDRSSIQKFLTMHWPFSMLVSIAWPSQRHSKDARAEEINYLHELQ